MIWKEEMAKKLASWWFKVPFLGWLSDLLERLSDLQLADERVTSNHLDGNTLIWISWPLILEPFLLACQKKNWQFGKKKHLHGLNNSNTLFSPWTPWSHHQGTNGSAHTPDLGGDVKISAMWNGDQGNQVGGPHFFANLASKNERNPSFLDIERRNFWKELLGFEDCIMFSLMFQMMGPQKGWTSTFLNPMKSECQNLSVQSFCWRRSLEMSRSSFFLPFETVTVRRKKLQNPYIKGCK